MHIVKKKKKKHQTFNTNEKNKQTEKCTKTPSGVYATVANLDTDSEKLSAADKQDTTLPMYIKRKAFPRVARGGGNTQGTHSARHVADRGTVARTQTSHTV